MSKYSISQYCSIQMLFLEFVVVVLEFYGSLTHVRSFYRKVPKFSDARNL